VSALTPANAADPAAGRLVFKASCAICHPIVANKNAVGPSLFGIVGSKPGQVTDFHYSDSNKNADLTWDEATLDKYLQAPGVVVPRTTMVFAGLKDDTKRGDLIAYLATLK